MSANADNLEHNNEINTKPDKTEIKSEERQNYGANAPYFAQNNETNTIALTAKKSEIRAGLTTLNFCRVNWGVNSTELFK